jgi:hypothetical protein
MPMTPFVERFPDFGPRETRFISVPQEHDLPAGDYGFLELYCNEPGCDCRRVTILVLRPETGWSKPWATIGFGWETLDFYKKWGGARSDPLEMQGPYLDPLNVQTQHSPALLDVFRLILQSPDYVERLKRHYQMFRKSVENDKRNSLDTSRLQNKRRRLRDPQRRHPH